MNIFKLAVELFIIYMAYKLVFEFIIPVYRTTKQMKQKMSKMQQKMHEQHDINNQSYKAGPENTESPQKSYSDDYIEYEEIK